MEHSANVSAWQNQLHMPFACNSSVCKQRWHLGLAGSPVTRDSPEISHPTEPRLRMLCGELARKSLFAKSLDRTLRWSSQLLGLVVSLKGSRSYLGSAEYTHISLPDLRHGSVGGVGFPLCHHHGLSHGSGMRTWERTTLGACSFIPTATQESGRWSLGPKALQLFHFVLGGRQPLHRKG